MDLAASIFGKRIFMENELLMPFINQSPIYVLGFELGQVWQILESGECIDYRPIHKENVEQFRLMGRH